jgi:hypothetical protein
MIIYALFREIVVVKAYASIDKEKNYYLRKKTSPKIKNLRSPLRNR